MNLNDSNYADMLAMLNYFKEKFIPAFVCKIFLILIFKQMNKKNSFFQNILCWLDEANTYTVIRRAYGKYLRFPFSLIKLRHMSQTIQNTVISNYRSSFITIENIKLQVNLI